MALERLRAQFGFGRRRRYVNVDDIADLEEISNPEETTDDTRTTLTQFAANNAQLALGLGVVLLFGFIAALYFFGRFIPRLLGNIYVQATVAGLLILGTGLKIGRSKERELISEIAEVTLRYNDTQQTFKGTILRMPGKDRGALFVPFKGVRLGGTKWEPYRIRELGAPISERHQYRVDRSNAVRIHLHPKTTTASDTSWGERITCHTGELEPADGIDGATLRTTLPEYDDNDLDEMATELEQSELEKRELREERNKYRRKYRKEVQANSEPVTEQVQERLETVGMLMTVARGGRRKQQAEENGEGAEAVFGQADDLGFRGAGSFGGFESNGESDMEAALEDVEEEVSEDDE